MMKLKYSICCGLDVHKNVIVATIVTTNKDGISEYLQKSFSTINSDIQRFHNWLIENNCYHVCMESTGKCWILGVISLALMISSFAEMLFGQSVIVSFSFSIDSVGSIYNGGTEALLAAPFAFPAKLVILLPATLIKKERPKPFPAVWFRDDSGRFLSI